MVYILPLVAILWQFSGSYRRLPPANRRQKPSGANIAFPFKSHIPEYRDICPKAVDLRNWAHFLMSVFPNRFLHQYKALDNSGVLLYMLKIMLKSCSKCGKVHPKGYVCQHKCVEASVRNSEADRFRNTQTWRNKAIDIKKRDFYLCRVCLRGDYNTINRLNSNRLSVHHIIPLKNDFGKRLDDDNLITLCDYHHELAEKGAIPAAFLRGLAASPLRFTELK